MDKEPTKQPTTYDWFFPDWEPLNNEDWEPLSFDHWPVTEWPVTEWEPIP